MVSVVVVGVGGVCGGESFGLLVSCQRNVVMSDGVN
jgi:hypothetical protein